MNELYSSHERRLDTVMGQADFWRAMRECRDAEGQEHCTSTLATIKFFFDAYGIQLALSRHDMDRLSTEYTVVDEQKYLIFLLKYSKGNV